MNICEHVVIETFWELSSAASAASATQCHASNFLCGLGRSDCHTGRCRIWAAGWDARQHGQGGSCWDSGQVLDGGWALMPSNIRLSSWLQAGYKHIFNIFWTSLWLASLEKLKILESFIFLEPWFPWEALKQHLAGRLQCTRFCQRLFCDAQLLSDQDQPFSRTDWWFGTFFIFPYIGNNHPNWLIFVIGVETTNQRSLGGSLW